MNRVFIMMKTCMSSRRGRSRGLVLFLVLVCLQLHLCYSQGPKIEDCSRFYGYYCVTFGNCPSGPEFVRKRIATVCGFENGGVKICCPRPNSSSITPQITTRSTSTTTRPPTRITPIISRPTPSTSSTRPTPVRPTPVKKNATATAISKCKEYERYQYEVKYLDPLIPGDVQTTFYELNCVRFATLIVGGVPSDPKEYPHMALIGYGNNFRNVDWACGGSLISEKFVLSAAHCETSELGEAKWALLGELNITPPKVKVKDSVKPKVYSIVRRFNHPNYKPPSVYNDIALFELNTTVEISPFARPACLYTSRSIEVNTPASITGWGLTGAAERRSSALLKAKISIQEEDLCFSEYSTSSKLDHGYEPSSMVCAGDLVTGNDTCPGDSGGPLQVQVPNTTCMWAVAGITSIGPGICGNLESPGIYTRVANYLDWIQGIVWP